MASDPAELMEDVEESADEARRRRGRARRDSGSGTEGFVRGRRASFEALDAAASVFPLLRGCDLGAALASTPLDLFFLPLSS